MKNSDPPSKTLHLSLIKAIHQKVQFTGNVGDKGPFETTSRGWNKISNIPALAKTNDNLSLIDGTKTQ